MHPKIFMKKLTPRLKTIKVIIIKTLISVNFHRILKIIKIKLETIKNI